MAPLSGDLGVMLPYSPLHHLLLADAGMPLVMTSGNVSDEPIAYRDEDALERLGAIADLFLLHDRPIQTRTDDSVQRSASVAGRRRTLMLRRSRGYVPESVDLPVAAPRPVLACGAELKNTFCLAKGRRAWVGHHVGDLENYETLRSFREGIAHFERLFAVEPQVVAHDLHPGYLSTAYALEREGVELIGVQHHHAHLAACLAEHGEQEPAVGAIYDGTGYGDGRHRLGRRAAVRRPARLRAHRPPAPGAAARRRTGDPRALADGVRLAGARRSASVRRCRPRSRARSSRPLGGRGRAGRERHRVAPDDQRRAGFSMRSPRSAGSAPRVNYEGQAAAELEAAADPAETGAYPLPVDAGELDPRETVLAVAARRRRGRAPSALVSRPLSQRASPRRRRRPAARRPEQRGLETVVLSGGVFQNALLLERTSARAGGPRPAGARAGAAAAERRRHLLRAGRGRGRPRHALTRAEELGLGLAERRRRAGRRTATRARSGASSRSPRSWPSTASVSPSMRRANIVSGGIVWRRISSQKRECGPLTSIIT